MKIKGVPRAITELKTIVKNISNQIDEIDWDKPNADEKDERLNTAWDCVAAAISDLEDIKGL